MTWLNGLGWRHESCVAGLGDSTTSAWPVLKTASDRAGRRSFPPVVALHLIKLACELPARRGVPLALWDCRELARQLVDDGVVETISPETVRRILASSELKPWQHQMWLSPKVPRDGAFAALVCTIVDLYTRPLAADEVVLCVDEKTNIQPRPRTARTTAAARRRPARLEHEYARDGALNLFAAFNTRTGEVIGWSGTRKRADEFISFLEYLDALIPAGISRVYLVLDNLRVHKGKAVHAWLAEHPRFLLHFPPVHCSWMNQVEQWFSILQRKLLRLADFAGALALDRALHGFIARWNRFKHPFNWTSKSVTKVLARCDANESLFDAA